MHSGRDLLNKLDKLAEKAAADSTEVKVYVESLLGNTIFSKAANALKQRCVAAEVRYRVELRPPVTERQVVLAFNRLETALDIPGLTPIDEAQLRAFRLCLGAYVPHVLESITRHPDQSFTNEMSPMGALYLVSSLFKQEFASPAFPEGAERWASIQERMLKDRPDRSNPTAIAYTVSFDVIAPLVTFRNDVAKESSISAKQFSDVLDELNF